MALVLQLGSVMACFHPINIRVQSDDPREVEGDETWQTVGCGICLGCRADQARDWAIRIMHESRMHRSAFF